MVPVQIDIDKTYKRIRAGVDERSVGREARIVDQDVDPAELFPDRPSYFIDVELRPDVTTKGQCARRDRSDF